MACDISGGCRICPGMWIAAAVMAVMVFQSWYARPTAPKEPTSVESSLNTDAESQSSPDGN